jgi:ELWxxDGT repeat protein
MAKQGTILGCRSRTRMPSELVESLPLVKGKAPARSRGLRFVVPALVLAAVSILAVPAFTAPVYKIGKISARSPGNTIPDESDFVVFKNYIYFAGGTTGVGGTGIELWRTDGTEAGTTLVKDINTTTATASSDPGCLTVVPNPLVPPSDPNYETLYFAAADGLNGRELWKSDGTPQGTVMVADINPGYGSSSPGQLIAVAGQVVFNCLNGLCKSDGTAAGTVGDVSLVPDASPSRFVELNGVVYFWGGPLYRWDLQTAPVNVSSPLAPRVQEIVKLNNKIYFTTQLWNSTFYVYDPATGVTSKVLDMPEWKEALSLTVVGSRALFAQVDSSTGAWEGLWQFDGTTVSPITPVLLIYDMKELGGALYLAADDGVHGSELWTSDGSTAHLVKDINPGPGGSGIASWEDPFRTAAAFAGSVYFFADDGVHGKELWKTDGTEAGTLLVEDIVPGSGSSYSAIGGSRGYKDEYLALGVVPAGGSGPTLHALSLRPPRFAIDDVTLPEGTGSPSNAVLTVHLIPPSAQDTSVQWATSDGTATAGVDYTPATGTLDFPAGTASQTLSVAIVPDATPEVGEKTFHVQLSGSSGPPIGRGFADATIFDDDGPTVSINDISVQENTGTATFTVTRSTATSNPVHVDYTTVSGTATAGSDYTTKSGSVTFPAGQVTQPVTVSIVKDSSYEPDEVFYVQLSHPDYGVLGKAEGQCTIVNDDLPPTLTVPDVTVTEGNTGTSNMTFTATLSTASAYATSVDFVTADGTATAGADYQAQSGTLTIPAGTASGTVVVPITGDVIDEPNETLTLNLSNPVNATLARAQATGTINDNDTTTMSVNNVTVVEGALGTTVLANLAVTLSTPNSRTVTVDYATAPGTTNPATDGVDYTGVSGTLTFPPGTTSLPVPVTVIGDNVDEGTSETFFLNLTNATNATLPANTHGTVTITDDDLSRFAVGDVSVVEGNSGTATATLTVTLGCAYKGDTSIKYYTSNGTALATGATPDFVGISNGTTAGAVLLVFPAGTISQDVTVQVFGDTVKEVNNEYFYLNLTGASGGPTTLDGQAKVTILDDDLLATDRRLSIAPKAVSVTEPSSGETPTAFTVSLIPASGTTPTPSGLPVTVSIVAGGTASTPADYTGVPASLTFAPGTTAQTITAAVQSDAILENPETVILTLASPTNATIAASSTTTSGSATLTLYDAVSRDPLDFYTVEPCRAVDTRDAGKGGPAPVAAGTPRTFPIGGVCGVPATARAVSVNVTVVGPTVPGNVRVYPAGTGLPSSSNLNFLAGQTRANNAIVLLSALGDVTVAVATGTAHVIIDANGYME